jgi:hypothetical protein
MGVREVVLQRDRIISRSRQVASKPVGTGTSYPQDVVMDIDDDNHEIDGNPSNFLHGDDDKESGFGYEARGTSPTALKFKLNNDRKFDKVVNDAIHISADTLPTRASGWQGNGMVHPLFGSTTSSPKQNSQSTPQASHW